MTTATASRPKTAARPKAAAPQTDKRLRATADLFRMLADPTRLKVLLMLAEGELHVTAMCERLGQSQPAVSHHLCLARISGLIEAHRSGKNNFYSLTETGRTLAGTAKGLMGG